MKRFLQKKLEQIRLLAVLLVTVCAFSAAHAQLSSDEISEAILLEGSVPVTWTNDTEHPWILGEANGFNELKTPETGEDSAFTASVSFTYSSKYPTILYFEWYRGTTYNYNDDILRLSIDGEENRTTRSNWSGVTLRLPEGSHTVEFTSVSTRPDFDEGGYRSAIRNIKITEIKELESACLAEGSLPLTIKNVDELDLKWTTEDGYIRSHTGHIRGGSSKISTTFTIDIPSLFSFEWRNGNNYYNNGTQDNLTVTIDGVFLNKYIGTGWGYQSIVLYPGTHVVEFVNWNDYTGTDHYSELRNVRLDQTWYDVTLNAPGELGTRLTQALEGKPIQDMELLKIRGNMNSDDWASIKLLTGIKAIDFTESGITEIPASAFEGLGSLSTALFPETLKSIGNKAFYRTDSHRFIIPASVETIGSDVWKETPLRYVDIEENSKLSFIGCAAFCKTRIMEFIMPETVETLGTYDAGNWDNYYDYYDGYVHRYMSSLFEGCTSLKKLHLSDSLDCVPGLLASGCTSLEEVNIPVHASHMDYYAFNNTAIRSIDIPEAMRSIGRCIFEGSALESVTIPNDVTTMSFSIFASNKNLKEAYLNSHCWAMDNIFAYCTALEKVVLPCATPPTTVGNDPFRDIDKSKVTLVVPDFAFDSYRTNSYWYKFTNTVKGDEASINDYWALRGNLSLSGTLVMQGKPSVEMMPGSKLSLDSNSAQTFNEFTYHTNESNPTTVYSRSNDVKADRLVSKFYVSAKDAWFFFSPVTDVKMSDITYPSTDSWMICFYDGARRASEDSASGNWITVPSDGTLKGGQGYIIQAKETGWLYLPSASAEDNDKFFGSNAVTFDLADNPCETEANAGWNFVANPYPTYYDIYYIDMQAPITVWDGRTYRAYSLNDGDRGDDTFVLRPMQPFFVQKSASTPDLKAGMPLVGRQVTTAIDRSRAPRQAVKAENRLKLNLELFREESETADDYTRVVLNEQSSAAYESTHDASKFMSLDSNVAQLYSLGAEGIPMAINERPYADGNVALGVLLPATDCTYRISALRADRRAWLFDAETGMEFDLTEDDYVFSASKAGIDNSRFSIRFAPAVNSVEGIDASYVKVTGNAGSISVSAPAGAAVAVFGTDGSVITSTTAESGNLEISTASGVYVVKVNGKSYKTIVK